MRVYNETPGFSKIYSKIKIKKRQKSIYSSLFILFIIVNLLVILCDRSFLYIVMQMPKICVN